MLGPIQRQILGPSPCPCMALLQVLWGIHVHSTQAAYELNKLLLCSFGERGEEKKVFCGFSCHWNNEFESSVLLVGHMSAARRDLRHR